MSLIGKHRYCSGTPTVNYEGDAVKVRVGGWEGGSSLRRWRNPAGSFPFNHVTSKTSPPLSYRTGYHKCCCTLFFTLHKMHLSHLTKLHICHQIFLPLLVWPPHYSIRCDSWILNKVDKWLTKDHGWRLKSDQSKDLTREREGERGGHLKTFRVALMENLKKKPVGWSTTPLNCEMSPAIADT